MRRQVRSLLTLTGELRNADAPALAEAAAALMATGEQVEATREGADASRLALAPFSRAEAGLASRLQVLVAAGDRARVANVLAHVDWSAAFCWLADRHGLTLAAAQEEAVAQQLGNRVELFRITRYVSRVFVIQRI